VLKLVQLYDVCSFENKARSIKGKTMYTHTNSQKFQLLKKVVDECTLLCNVLLITLCVKWLILNLTVITEYQTQKKP
jgi:cell division protein FtsL